MSIKYVKSLFESDKEVVVFEGKCHDCGRSVAVECRKSGDEVSVAGGAYWRQVDRDFVKCLECFQNSPMLTNYMPCEIYSRVTGYLRPVKQWNPGKREEFKARKNFILSE